MLDGDNAHGPQPRPRLRRRTASVRRVGELAALFNAGGVITLVTLVSPYRADRDAAKARHGDMGLKFLEVYMNVDIDAVQARDPKGLYAKVKAGEITSFTGMSEDAPTRCPSTRTSTSEQR
ncbi:adenylylsulfate kinase [Aureococcus anophagefferens]|nr:adenylylsulfate kinase [Aureococcus anophagefferens]